LAFCALAATAPKINTMNDKMNDCVFIQTMF
jgi:hypothetical protein